MKRMQLFELEDQPWFPHWIRVRMTRFLNTFHKMIGTAKHIAELINKLINDTGQNNIIDLCSGSCGPMRDVYKILKENNNNANLSIKYHDLFPDTITANEINTDGDINTSYFTDPINILTNDRLDRGIRTMICSFHHFPKEKTKAILQSAVISKQPIFIFEISDNSFPKWIWWISIPITFIMTLFVTPFIRPMSWQQIIFTYLIPILPLAIAWDGAVSNARTYTLNDLDELLSEINSEGFKWEKAVVKDKVKMLYLFGLPT